MKSFVESVAGVLEVESIGLEDDFRATEGWCSLHAFGLLVMLENDYGARVSLERFMELKTVRDLYAEAFLAFAAELLKVPRASISLSTAHGSLSEWDSVAHLRLVMEAEARFGSSYPIEKIPALKTLGDFL